MATWTLAQLRTRVRERADMVHSQFVSDSEVNGYISNSYAKFYDLVTSAYVDDYVSDPVEFTISSGNTYALPSTFYKLVGLDFYYGSDWVEVRNFNFNLRNSKVSAYNVSRYHPTLRYKLMGSSSFWMIPTDQATGTYRYFFIPKYTALTLDTDTMDGYNGWEEFIVYDAAIKCLIKEESDVQVFQMERAKIENDLMAAAKSRDTGETETITDVNANEFDFFGY